MLKSCSVKEQLVDYQKWRRSLGERGEAFIFKNNKNV